uniref:Uncharacterized protein n=1 Tax=Arundo donax TaxID=35708 RepID=A0A0A9G190_ARUDO
MRSSKHPRLVESSTAYTSPLGICRGNRCHTYSREEVMPNSLRICNVRFTSSILKKDGFIMGWAVRY